MKLADQTVAIIDCQTTGANPRDSYLLELGWMVGSASAPGTVESRLIALPEDASLPPRIARITGIGAEELLSASAPADVLEEFVGALSQVQSGLAVAHYARFEESFLRDFFDCNSGRETLPVSFICTCEIAKRLYPDLPSRAIRALVGYFGLTIGEMKRASCHVQATFHIWRRLVSDLADQGIETPEQLTSWLQSPRPKKVERSYELPMERLKRLEMPDQPGVYHMLSSTGQILYVGKATSLKDRVNSYFRGRKGKDSKTKELISQIFDIRVEILETPLEAALRETDLIKLHDPPYNRALRQRGRQLIFFSRDFSLQSSSQSREVYLGPFCNDAMQPLLDLQTALSSASFDPALFWGLVPEEMGLSAMQSFLQLYSLSAEKTTVRGLLALGMRMLREELRQQALAEVMDEETELEPEAEIEPEAESESESESEDDDQEELQEADVLAMICGILVRSARLLRQCRELTGLLNATVSFVDRGKERTLYFSRGSQVAAPKKAKGVSFPPWSGLQIDSYDRMRVLSTELTRVGGSVRIAENWWISQVKRS